MSGSGHHTGLQPTPATGWPPRHVLRRSLCALALTVAIVLLAGCGGGGSSNSTPVAPVDTTPPAAPTVNAVTSPTNVTTQTLSGTKEANSSILINGSVAVTLDANTTWTAVVTFTAQGANTFSITSMDAAGNQTSAVSVSIIYDSIAPTVASTAPDSASSGVATNSALIGNFSEAIDQTTISASTFTLQQGATPVNGTLSTTATSATFTPTSNLQYSTPYTATLTTGVADLAANRLTTDYVWTFTTGAASDTTPPHVLSTIPASSQINVPLNTQISATFDEAIASSTVPATAVTVSDGIKNISETVSFGTTGATFTPSVPLRPSIAYTATVTTAIKDLAGNTLPTNYVWNFTTSSDGVAPTISASPGSGGYRSDQSVTITCTDGGSGCKRIVYTTDRTVPRFSPANGIVVNGTSAGPVTIGAGDTILRFAAEDNAGNLQAVHEELYSVSATGFLYAVSDQGLARGRGPVPTAFTHLPSAVNSSGISGQSLFYDSGNGRIYYGTTDDGLFFSDDSGHTFVQRTTANGLPANLIKSLFAVGSRVLAGTFTQGLGVSSDGGASFTTRGFADGIGRLPGYSGVGPIDGIAVNGEDVYLALFSQGVAVSHDGGVTFVTRSTADGLGDNIVYDIVVQGGVIYAGTDGGLSTSSDRGATFVNKTTVDGLGSNTVKSVFLDGSTLYASTSSGLSISTNWGTSFSIKFPGSPVHSVYASGASIYVIVGTFGDVLKSVDGGTTYSTPSGFPGLSKRASRVTGNGINSFFLSVGLVYSNDDATTFKYGGIGSKNVSGLAVSGSTVWVGLDSLSGDSPGQVAYSADGGGWYDTKAFGDVRDIALVGGTHYVLLSQQLMTSTDGGSSFLTIGFPSIHTRVFADGSNVYIGGTTSGLMISNDSGGTFPITRTTTDGLGSNEVNDIFAAGLNVYVATTNGLSISTNGGVSFVNKNAIGGLGGDNALAVTVSGSSLYVGLSGGGLAISTDGGTTFSVRTTADGLGGNTVNQISASGSTLYVATSGRISISTNGGTSFTTLTTSEGLLSNTIKRVAYAP